VSPAPTVYVFVQLVHEQGAEYWLRYVYVGSDHDEAANEAVERMNGSHRIRAIETFDGEPRRYFPGAVYLSPRKLDVLEREST
jgi:hypothetical protein